MQVKLLGPVQVTEVGGPIPLGGPKERAVLALLALHAGEVVIEDRLIEAVWSDDPPRTAARTLQSYVSRLRKTLGDLQIDSVGGGYRMRAGEETIDAKRVERMGADARDAAAREDHERAADLYAQALAEWTGRPLGEFADESWARPEAVRLTELRQTLMEERVEADLQCGRHALLAGELEAACRANPFRERLWGQHMLALYRSGRQADALSVYREVRRRLSDELGVDPSPELQALERAILTQDATLQAPVVARSATTGDETSPFPPGLGFGGPADFVGRGAELETLHDSWRRNASGECRAVFIGGEPGIGKTRLVGEFARGIYDAGATVLFGACEEDLNIAYQPFAEALRPLVERAPVDLLRMQVRRYGGDLARLVPEILLRLPDTPRPLQAEADSERFRLFEATAALLEAAAEHTPLLLVIDDLHWANKPTLLLLRHLLRQPCRAPLMVVGLYRDTESSDALTDTLADLRRIPGVERISLGGLTEDGVLAYLEASAGYPLGDEGRPFAHRLRDETGGSPFFVGELIRHIGESGLVHREGERWTSDLPAEQFELPASVREVVTRRLGTLSEATRNALTVASVIGAHFSLSFLEEIEATGADDGLLDCIEEAVVAGMVRDVPGSPGTYAFAHTLVRHVLHEQLSVLRRARLHRRVAEALEARSGDDSARLGEIAMHYLAAAVDGVADKAIHYAGRAAVRATERVAYEEAVRLFEQGLEVAEWAEQSQTTVACDLLLGLAGAQWKVGDVLPSRENYRKAAELARHLHDPRRLARAALRSYADVGGYAHGMATNAEVVAVLEEALDGIGSDPTELRSRLLARLAVELFFTPFAQPRTVLADEAVAIAERLGDREVLLFALHCREWATYGPGVTQEDRLTRATAILDLARELGDIEVAYQARFLRLVTFLEAGDFASADTEASEGAKLAERLGVPGFVPWVAAYDSLRAWIDGRIEEADALNANALEEALQHGADPDLVFTVIGAQGFLFRYLRDLADIVPMLEPMIPQYPNFAALQAGVAFGYFQADNEEKARLHYDTLAASDFSDQPHEGTWLLNIGMLAQVSVYLGDDRRAAILYDMLLPFADRWMATVVSTIGPISRVLGRLAAALRRFDEAETHYQRCLEQTRETPAPLFEAETHYDYAAMLVARDGAGDRDLAREHLHRAARAAEDLKLTTLQRWGSELEI